MRPEPSAATAGSHWSPVVRPSRLCAENCGGAAHATLASANSNKTNYGTTNFGETERMQIESKPGQRGEPEPY